MSEWLLLFETKSNRVKGLSFHPHRPWILASLHNGVIQLWDYRIKALIEQFEEHEGPVRGVCFHHSQPLFASGGDDYKIKVWNYKERTCLFTLLGHMDYIRTVQFHHEYPWILSASDDQTLRLWNWQSRQCLCVLTGHNHYVMCAAFHPTDDLVVSASLDQSIRVWDISGLRKKNISPMATEDSFSNKLQPDLFGGTTDAIVKYVLEGHDRGVNWVSFHPTLPLIISGSDDNHIKLWRMNDTKAWEVDTLRGHYNNVSSCIFHPRQEIILSNSEDRTIRVWDLAKRISIHQPYRLENDRFWILQAHPKHNLFAAGHDNGMIIFKLEKERPAYTTHNDSLYYIKDRYIRIYDFESARDIPLVSIRASKTPRCVSYNPAERTVILSYPGDGHYAIHQLPKDQNGGAGEPQKGAGLAAVWVARNRFVVLDKTGKLYIKNLNNEVTKKCDPPQPTDMIFPAHTGSVLLRSDDRVTLFDVQKRQSLGELVAPNVKFVLWSSNDKNAKVALLCKDTVIISNRKMESLCVVHEVMKIKSGVWDSRGIFIYNTKSHIKYLLPTGDRGIIRTLDVPIYITAIKGNRVFCLDRDVKNRSITIDMTECMFKYYINHGKFREVRKMVKGSNLIGQSIIAYLQKKGFPEVALYFVKDEKTRLSLALECGNLDVAFDAAKKLDDKGCWERLGNEALMQGNHAIVEVAYQKTMNFERLSFLYLITGNTKKIKAMLRIANLNNNIMARFHNSLYLGDVQSRVKLLEDVGQYNLAYLTASTHGLEDADRLAKVIQHVQAKRKGITLSPEGEEGGVTELPPADLPKVLNSPKLLIPPVPIMRLEESNWPLLSKEENPFAVMLKQQEAPGQMEIPAQPVEEEPSYMQEEDQQSSAVDDTDPWKIGDDIGDDVDPDLWGDDLGFDIPDMDAKVEGQDDVPEENFVRAPRPGTTTPQLWVVNSSLAADHVAAGQFESAMKLLNSQIGIVNFAPMKGHFMSLYSSSNVQHWGLPSLKPFTTYLQREFNASKRIAKPLIYSELQHQMGSLREGYLLTTQAKFQQACVVYQSILTKLPLLVVDSPDEVDQVKELISICREYTTGLVIELKRREVMSDRSKPQPVRAAELAALFTHCNLQPGHLMLCLRSAANICVKIKNFATAHAFATRLLELNPKTDVLRWVKKVIHHCEQNQLKESCAMDYDGRNPFVICSGSFTPIYRGSDSVKCGYCQATYKPEFKGKLCRICRIARIGAKCSGLQVY